MRLGLGLSLSNCCVDAAVECDPSTLELTTWTRTNYVGQPWAGTASAGDSGDFSWVADNPAATDTTLNGLVVANFDGTNDRFYKDTVAMADIITASAWWLGALVYVDSVAAAGGAWYSDEVIVGDNQGAWGISISSSGVRAAGYDGAIKSTGFVTFGTGAWGWIEAWLEGGTLSCRVNGGTAQTVSCGNSSLLASSYPRLGANYNATTFFDGKIADVMTMASVPSAAVRTCIRQNYLFERYGLTLGT